MTPQTPTGKNVAESEQGEAKHIGVGAIVAIEHEAAQQERERLRKEVLMLPFAHWGNVSTHHPSNVYWLDRRVVLDLLADPEDG